MAPHRTCQRRIFVLAFLLTVTVFSAARSFAWNMQSGEADSSATARETYMHLRGLEKDKQDGGRKFRKALNTALFLPRTILDGLLYTTGFGARLVDDRKFTEKLSSFRRVLGRNLGWYPVVTVGSGSKPAVGSTVFYRKNRYGLSLSGYYGGDNFWRVKFNSLYTRLFAEKVLQINFSFEEKKRDNFAFHGFGLTPPDDPRNVFLLEAERNFGLYAQELTRAMLIAGLRPTENWQFFYTGYFQERKLTGVQNDGGSIENIFDLSAVPGIRQGRETVGKQLYNELAVRYDSREFSGQISPGIRIEAYAGLSLGVIDDDSRFARTGVDLAFYAPVIKRTRLFVPRVIFDVTENLSNDIPISFANFARQPAFRGASRRTLLRTDNISMLPSLEYQWPLTYNLGGHLFFDYLLVAPSVGDLTFSGAPYVYGIGFDIHSVESELARLTISNGSEGGRIFLTIGLALHTSDRTHWE